MQVLSLERVGQHDHRDGEEHHRHDRHQNAHGVQELARPREELRSDERASARQHIAKNQHLPPHQLQDSTTAASPAENTVTKSPSRTGYQRRQRDTAAETRPATSPTIRMRRPRAVADATRKGRSPVCARPSAAPYTLYGMPDIGWLCIATGPFSATSSAAATCMRAVVNGAGSVTPCAASAYIAAPPATLAAAATRASRTDCFGAARARMTNANSGSSGSTNASPNAHSAMVTNPTQDAANAATRRRRPESGRRADGGAVLASVATAARADARSATG